MAKNPRKSLNLAVEFAASWTRLWKANLESRLKGHDHGGRTYFLTATDLERDVRDELTARMRAERPDECGTLRISGLGGRPLLDHVRAEVRSEVRSGRADDRGRGHCSSMRFRPAGAPASQAEKKADAVPVVEKSRRRFVVHFHRETEEIPFGDGTRERLLGRLCETKPRKRSFYSHPRRSIYPTNDPARVSCKKCRKILEREFVRVVSFGTAADPVISRVLEREADGSARAAVDAAGNVYYAVGPGIEFLPAEVVGV